MAWAGSDRRESLPSNWDRLRKRRFRMDGYRCTATDAYGNRCTEPAEECDHIGDREDHRIDMLRSLCKWHHGKKSGSQGAAAARKKRQEIDKRFRRVETHPGDM